ncbi:MAG: endonuclease, partial [Odoribacter sp.]|nr:endonuclease [Odoribacter sp.]
SISKTLGGQAKIIIAGDFNCTPGDVEMSLLTGTGNNSSLSNEANMVNLSSSFANKGIGSYRYRGTWEMIDQVIVSEWFLTCGEGYFADTCSFRVFNPAFLLQSDPVYPGFTPYSTYRGYRYQGGFSDHLPVILDLRKK